MKFQATIEILIEKLQVRVQEEEEEVIKPQQVVIREDVLLVKMEAILINLTNVMKGTITIEMEVVAAVVVANHQGMWWEAVVITVVAPVIEDEIIKVNVKF